MLVCIWNGPLATDFVAMQVLGILSKVSQNIICICKLRFHGLSLLRSQGLWDICVLEAPALEHFKLGVSTPYLVTFV